MMFGWIPMIFPVYPHDIPMIIQFNFYLDEFHHDRSNLWIPGGFLDAHPDTWGDDRMVGDVVLMDTDTNGNPTVVGVETVSRWCSSDVARFSTDPDWDLTLEDQWFLNRDYNRGCCGCINPSIQKMCKFLRYWLEWTFQHSHLDLVPRHVILCFFRVEPILFVWLL